MSVSTAVPAGLHGLLMLSVALLLNASVARAQDAGFSEHESARLDTLVSSGDLEAIYQALEGQDVLAWKEPAELQRYLSGWRRLSFLFDEERTGPLAVRAYARFEVLSGEAGREVEAARWFHVAQLLRERYAQQRFDDARADYFRARDHLLQGDPEQAQAVLDQIPPLPDKNAFVDFLPDSLRKLRADVDRARARQAREDRFWRQGEVFHYRYGFTIGGQLLARSGVADGTLLLIPRDGGREETADVEWMKVGVGTGYTLEAFSSFGGGVSAGVVYSFAGFSYRDVEHEYFYYDFDVYQHFVQLYTQYAFRQTRALRPFVRLGGGWQGLRRPPSEAKVLFLFRGIGGEVRRVERWFDLPRQRQNGFGGHLGLGLEAMDVFRKRITVATEARFTYGMLKHEFVKPYGLSFGVRVGTAF